MLDVNIEISVAPSIASTSGNLELDTNYSNDSITRSDSNEAVVNLDYTKNYDIRRARFCAR